MADFTRILELAMLRGPGSEVAHSSGWREVLPHRSSGLHGHTMSILYGPRSYFTAILHRTAVFSSRDRVFKGF